MYQDAKSVAVMLNVTGASYQSCRLIDIVKDQLIQFIRNQLDEADVFYLYNPVQVDVMANRGDQICVVGNYETDGYKSKELSFALKQTYYVLAGQDEDTRRVLFYITNNFIEKDSIHLKKLFNIDRTLGDLEEPCEIVVVSLKSKNVDFSKLEEVCKDQASLLMVEDPLELHKVLGNFLEDRYVDIK